MSYSLLGVKNGNGMVLNVQTSTRRTSLFKIVFFISLNFLLAQSSLAIRGEVQSPSPAAYTKGVVQILKFNKDREKGLQPVCTGSLIAKNIVLTAAHCFDDKNYEVEVAYQGNRIKVKKVRIAENYKRVDVYDDFYHMLDRVDINNDLALLHLKVSQSLRKKLNLVKIPKSIIYPKGSIIFSGYGQTANIFGIGEGAGVLRVSMPSDMLEFQGERVNVISGSSGTCLGDSGGPAWHKKGLIRQIGIVSMSDCSTNTDIELISWEKINKSSYKEYVHE